MERRWERVCGEETCALRKGTSPNGAVCLHEHIGLHEEGKFLPVRAYLRAKFPKEPAQHWPKPSHNQRKAQHADDERQGKSSEECIVEEKESVFQFVSSLQAS